MAFQKPVIKDAEYEDQDDADYSGNPLIEALGRLPTPVEFRTGLEYAPPVPTDKDRALSPMLRVRAARKLHHLVMPTPEYKYAAVDLSLLLRDGYIARNPMLDEDEVRRTAISNWDFKNPLKLPLWWKSSATGFLIISPTGTGKTTFMNAFLLRLPQVIRHVAYKGEHFVQHQVVYVKISVPPDGTVKAFCLTFFAEVDRLLGTAYYKQAVGVSTVPKMTILMGKVAAAISLGMLIVDEFQNLRCTKSAQGVQVLNLFVSLMEDSGIPVVTMATPKVYGLLELMTRDTRKLILAGGTYFQPMKSSDPLWKEFCKRLWAYSYTSDKKQLTADVINAWHSASGGIAGFAVLAFSLAQKRAIIDDTLVDEHSFEWVKNTQMATLQPAIDAVLSRNADTISKYEDLLMGPDARALVEQMNLSDERPRGSASNQTSVPAADDQSDDEFLGTPAAGDVKEAPRRSGRRGAKTAPTSSETVPAARSTMAGTEITPLPKRSVDLDM